MSSNNGSYVGTTPWGYGTGVSELKTAAEALEAGHLTWGVVKEPLTAHLLDGSDHPVRKKYTVRRDDTDSVIGIVGKNFRPVPNLEAMGLMDALALEHEAKFEAVGSIGDGERVWMLAKLPGEIRVKGLDTVEQYLLLSNAHDGSKSLVVSFLPFRARSTAVMNTSTEDISASMSIRHTKKFDEHVKEMRRVLKIKEDYFQSLGEMFDNIADIKVGKDRLLEVLDAVMPLPIDGTNKGKAESAREKLMDLYNVENQVNPIPNSGWSFFCAASNYADHHKSFKSRKDEDGSKEQIRFLSITEGASQSLKEKVLNALLNPSPAIPSAV
jgi:phage/plasmid-like protein (TIGR03299 family)